MIRPLLKYFLSLNSFIALCGAGCDWIDQLISVFGSVLHVLSTHFQTCLLVALIVDSQLAKSRFVQQPGTVKLTSTIKQQSRLANMPIQQAKRPFLLFWNSRKDPGATGNSVCQSLCSLCFQPYSLLKERKEQLNNNFALLVLLLVWYCCCCCSGQGHTRQS